MEIPQSTIKAIRTRVQTISIQLGELTEEYQAITVKGRLSSSRELGFQNRLYSLDKELMELDRKLAMLSHPAGRGGAAKKPDPKVEDRKDADILAFPKITDKLSKFYKEDN